MKVVAVCGSHRKGNTEWMLNKLMEKLKENGAEVELILLRKANVKMCLACLKCEEGGKNRKGICKIQDDERNISQIDRSRLPGFRHTGLFRFTFRVIEEFSGQDMRYLAASGRKTAGRCRSG